MTVKQAYRTCRGIARREAKNFYFAFLALPARKRDAICAVYAFMRRADDFSDDESQGKAQRRAQLDAWVAAWRHAAATGQTIDPVFIALNDARLRFRIPLALLDQLVEGTAMDLPEPNSEPESDSKLEPDVTMLSPAHTAALETFPDFNALSRYCYLVASVVGLVCIRIFGYSSIEAEKLAEELGLAFQLTNILRDVREDAARGRVYLPVDDLAGHGFTPETLVAAACSGAPPTPGLRALLEQQAARAEGFYRSGHKLLPLVSPDSRPALWVLMTIYHRLLGRIHSAGYDVFSRRTHVPTREKVALLLLGMGRTVLARLPARTARRSSLPRQVSVAHGESVAIIGAGVAGLSAACALADAGYRVTLIERRPYVGGRASSYLHPGSGEVIDNCQHILLGCCTNLRSLFARVGRTGAIAWTDSITYIEPGGRRSVVKPSRGPAPVHAAASFLGARCFSPADKHSIAMGLRHFFAGYPSDTPGSESFLSWARRNGQTPGALKRFWEPILQSALNDDLDRISLHYAGKVIRDSFLSSAEAGRIGVPLLPLSELYAGAARHVQSHGGTVRLRTTLEALEPTADGWQVHTRSESIPNVETFSKVVVALPWEATRQALPMLPSGPARDALGRSLGHFEHAPLVGIHLWFDREITDLPHAVLLDTTIQWMYQREVLQPGRSKGQGSHLELVVSVARRLVSMSQPEILDLALRELALFFPAVHEAKLLKGIVTKEVRATFCVTPGLDSHRPGARTGWPGLFLAGDWTDTGWPATMESAARSGFLAAEAVTGGRDRFLVDDLPPSGLMRLFG